MNNFQKAFNEVLSKIKSNKSLMKEIEIVALLGSVGNQEESKGWSDLDILVVLKSNDLGEIDLNAFESLKIIAKEISVRYSFPVSILPHTVDDFKNYVCFEYLKHYSFGHVAYSRNEELSELIGDILDKRNITDRELKSYCLYHFRHIRFNYFRKYVSVNKSNSNSPQKEIGKLLIDKMLKATDLALNYEGLWPKTKSEIVGLAQSNIGLSVSEREVLSEAFNLRKNWNKVTDEQLTSFVPKGNKYILKVISAYLGKEDNRPTPEERMTQCE